jgi:hypothetical protein
VPVAKSLSDRGSIPRASTFLVSIFNNRVRASGLTEVDPPRSARFTRLVADSVPDHRPGFRPAVLQAVRNALAAGVGLDELDDGPEVAVVDPPVLLEGPGLRAPHPPGPDSAGLTAVLGAKHPSTLRRVRPSRDGDGHREHAGSRMHGSDEGAWVAEVT